jgi:hypothetical protein
MGFLSKKNLLVSLLALSLAACETMSMRTVPPKTTIYLPCGGDAISHNVATTIRFEIAANSTCTLIEVDLIQDEHGNSDHIKKTKSATSSDPTVEFTYDGTPLKGYAYFYYVTQSPKTAGGGGGVIH